MKLDFLTMQIIINVSLFLEWKKQPCSNYQNEYVQKLYADPEQLQRIASKIF